MKRTLEQSIEKSLYILPRIDIKEYPEQFKIHYDLLEKYFKAYQQLQKVKDKIIYTDKYRIQLGD